MSRYDKCMAKRESGWVNNLCWTFFESTNFFSFTMSNLNVPSMCRAAIQYYVQLTKESSPCTSTTVKTDSA
jgi:hypothetical protein